MKFEVDVKYREQDHCYELAVIHNGNVIIQEVDGCEPEDNSFIREYGWISDALKKVYELGFEDGKSVTQKPQGE